MKENNRMCNKDQRKETVAETQQGEKHAKLISCDVKIESPIQCRIKHQKESEKNDNG